MLTAWPAAAYIKIEPLTLGNLCGQSNHIYVLKVEKVDAEKGLILFKYVEHYSIRQRYGAAD